MKHISFRAADAPSHELIKAKKAHTRTKTTPLDVSVSVLAAALLSCAGREAS